MKWRRLYVKIGNRFSAFFPQVFTADIGAHGLTNVKDAGSGWINADIFDDDFGIGTDQGSHKEKGSRRNVARNLDVLTVQSGRGCDRTGQTLLPDVGAKRTQHPFGMVSG